MEEGKISLLQVWFVTILESTHRGKSINQNKGKLQSRLLKFVIA